MNAQTTRTKKKKRKESSDDLPAKMMLAAEKCASAQEPGMKLQATKTKKRKQSSAASTRRSLAEKIAIAQERGRLEKADFGLAISTASAHQERGRLEKSMSMMQSVRTKKRSQASDDFSRRWVSGQMSIAQETGGRLDESRSTMPGSSRLRLDESLTMRMQTAKAKTRKHASFLVETSSGEKLDRHMKRLQRKMAALSERISTNEKEMVRKVAECRESIGTEVSRSDREIIYLDDSDDEDLAPDIEVRFKNQIGDESDSEVILERELTVNEIVKKNIRDAEAKGNVIVL
mmetsp:Transcript_16831/g.25268  ORF Transcript_16831/g.25268 Transcript_16831/m.25268 type:complete len:289 (+) Transcript_16831:139-1005(+)